MAGRPRKPTALHKLEGHKYKVAARENEPKPVPIAPDMPEHLSEVAQEMWQHLVPKLEKMDVLSDIDGRTFEIACECYSTYRKALRKIKKDGLFIGIFDIRVVDNLEGGQEVVKTQTGFKTSPAFKVANDALASFRQYMVEFGLSPASRAKLTVNDVNNAETEIGGMLTGG